MSVKFTGKIRAISIKEGKSRLGFIDPDRPIPGHEGDILFFADKLIGISIEYVERADVVEFSITEWNRKDGTIQKIAEEVRFLNKTISLTGVINWVSIEKGNGFIKTDQPLDNLNKDLFFFKEDLEEIQIENIVKGDKVRFVVKIINYRDGRVIKSVKHIQLLSPRTNQPIHSVTNIQTSDIVSPINSQTSEIEKSITNLQVYNNNIFNLKELKEKICLFLGNHKTLSDPAEFEDYTFMILRLLGIHSLYQYDKKNQAGRADGFFIIGSLAVMYDCTLRNTFEEHKKEQIENYVNKLKNSQITIDFRLTNGDIRKKTLQIQGKNCQVWIITKNNTRELYDVDGIRVKEVAVQDLMNVFNKRLYSDAFEEDELSANLAVIDKS
ncbi:MAG: cold shock domain-containing protein [Nostocales cyanobacterium LE14-WE4]|jgi:cold shock CspA family protein|nr:cold shock domain-containing protein [Anabaena sp. 49633_E8]MCE2701027.1 cold shock domain-containing protein [Anabaena sp. 49633_E8]MDJ0502262.1 cold shock domain-containing protein [Nostocales cyanobacterium LE14-WE4]